MKNKLIALLLSVFFVNALSAVIVSPIITDESSFFAIPSGETIGTYRSFHAEISEFGQNQVANVEVGEGNFIAESFYDVFPNWVVNEVYSFTLSYDASGNLTFNVGGVEMPAPLVYEPLNDINQIFVGNDNDMYVSFQGMELTNMTFSSGIEVVVLPDLITTGPNLKGLIVSDFGDTWSLSGDFSYTSPPDGGTLDHNSSFKFYGAVPEPASATLFGLISIIFVFTQRRR